MKDTIGVGDFVQEASGGGVRTGRVLAILPVQGRWPDLAVILDGVEKLGARYVTRFVRWRNVETGRGCGYFRDPATWRLPV
jgi:hypothetical protein